MKDKWKEKYLKLSLEDKIKHNKGWIQMCIDFKKSTLEGIPKLKESLAFAESMGPEMEPMRTKMIKIKERELNHIPEEIKLFDETIVLRKKILNELEEK